ncbi:hypothetical protein EV702DRAFT_1050750 [Suillus placidus]|uniref:3-beta hydroxysteroid dehydrogenase/isomerase domain-containing protein n=1 Tax=Suillus placidus TaxID=48579 RepID=A0A9P6ZHA2_9AGAM|nr:hypothetical protein EV702DRAFT_1050750 [Suillus placidus]
MRAIVLAHQNLNLQTRALVGPHHSLASWSALRHPSPAEPPTHQRVVGRTRYVLPPKTGRRYIVVGAGFLGGWITIQLLQRGEDPKKIRILDIHRPTRSDLRTGLAAQVAFFQVDICNAKAVDDAFQAPWPDCDPSETAPEVTVFHTAANIRFYERHLALFPRSSEVNYEGTLVDLNLVASLRNLRCHHQERDTLVDQRQMTLNRGTSSSSSQASTPPSGTPVIYSEAAHSRTQSYHGALDSDIDVGMADVLSESGTLAAMHALNDAWWSNMMMPGFSWPEGPSQKFIVTEYRAFTQALGGIQPNHG